MKKLTLTAVAVVAAAFAHGATVCGTGREMPKAYIPAMLSNGSLCMTADHLGGVPFPSQRTKSCRFSTGIFIAGRRLLYNLYPIVLCWGHRKWSNSNVFRGLRENWLAPKR